ncbi:hypothetical protein BSP38_066 [Bacillus phage BSP38]|uniref:Uncharacterized protein n=1 Tax=Bacillus phage BSP38 TaxID=2283013 RepID=A0A345MJS6_BPBSP|nr:hypothetical protein HWB82_gp252 [Bacillus phage BSP38]AXH71108.1 hypothetical protein BSP38_066 [Bacillus phage BSP38]
MPHTNKVLRRFFKPYFIFLVPKGEGGPNYDSTGARTRATSVTGWRVNHYTIEPTPLLGFEPRLAE